MFEPFVESDAARGKRIVVEASQRDRLVSFLVRNRISLATGELEAISKPGGSELDVIPLDDDVDVEKVNDLLARWVDKPV